MNRRLHYGLLAVMMMAIVACGGGGGGGGKKSSSSPPASSAPSSVAASSSPSSISSAMSSMESSTASSSSSSSSAGVSTTYNVRISPPDLGEPVTSRSWLEKLRSFIIPDAIAQEDEGENVPLENLAVVIVDLAGNVIETIPLDETNSTQNPDGSWSINVPGYPQLDCIVIANLNGPITLVSTDNIFDLYPNALFTPTTDEELDVSLASTAAYQNLLDELGGEGTFESLGLNVNDPTQLAVLENLIETVQQVIENQIFLGANNIAAALSQIQTQVVEIVKVEAVNVTAAVESTVSDAWETGGGIHWYEGLEAQEINHGAFVGDAPETIYFYNGTEFELSTENQESGDLVLGANGWVVTADNYSVLEQNEDGSLTLTDVDAPIEQINLKSTQSFNLAGRNIADFFNAYANTRTLGGILEPSAVFAEGSIGYRANVTSVNSTYSLWYQPGYGEEATCPWNKDGDPDMELASEFGGNCETVSSWTFNEGFPQHNGAVTSLAALKSADVAYNASGSRLVPIGGYNNGSQSIAVQLVDNTAKTANYFWYDWQTNLATTIGQGTWSQITLPHLEGDAAVAISFTLPDTVIEEGDFWSDEINKIFAVNSGFVRPGNRSEAGDVLELGFLVLNGIASDSVISATDYKKPVVGSWFDEATEGEVPSVLTFINNLQYTVTSFSATECENGLEVGYYQITGGSLSANQEIEEDSDCGLSSLIPGNSITVEGDTLSITEGEDVFNFVRVEGEGLLGTWIGEEPEDIGDHQLILSLLPENRFVFSQHGFSDAENGNNGYEYGTYTFDSETGAFVPTVSVNKDGSWGFSDSEATYTITTEGNEMTITVLDGEEEIVINLTRVTGSAN